MPRFVRSTHKLSAYRVQAEVHRGYSAIVNRPDDISTYGYPNELSTAPSLAILS